MAETHGHHPVGRHRLGPHVVGQRVVVRYLLPDGRATDVLGTCTSWGDEVAVVESARGPVEIRVADVVTGKPVPPRASVRHRDSPRAVELHTQVLWPDLESEPLGEWVLRCAPADGGRLRRRANSTLAMGDPRLPIEVAADRVRRWHQSRDREPMAMAVVDSEVEAALLTLGWRDLGSGAAHCQVAGVASALRGSRGRHARPARNARSLTQPGRVTVEVGDGVATGRATLDADWVVLDSVVVDEAHRRQGLATQVVEELLRWAASHGAMTAMLQVETDNAGAIRLYERLGFATHHTYRYLTG